MKIIIASLFLFFAWVPLVISQENPKIDIDNILSNSGDVGEAFIREKLDEGDTYYKKGFYNGSFRAYLALYKITESNSALNYRLGISALLGNKPAEASEYLLKCGTWVADDYYLQLGYAHQAELDYIKARNAFEQYNNQLSKWQQKKFMPLYNQLISECVFGKTAARDSVPAFVINLGPAVNSYYHEYGAVENSRHNRIFYTSRRPERVPDVPGSREKYDEHILEATYIDGTAAEGHEVSRLNGRFHTGVSGISHDEDFLFVYRGKKRGGQIRVADITGKKITRPSNISGRIDHKISKETTFFVSDRWGSKGGKDIWVAQRKGHGRYSKPVNMGDVINTSFDEDAVFVSHDGQTLFFASKGHPGFGGFDIYKSQKNMDVDWTIPENMGQPFNSPQDDLFFFPTSDPLSVLVSSSRPEGYGGLDLFKIEKDIRIPFSIFGTVSDKESGEPLYANLSLVDTLNRQELISEYTDSISGEYQIALEDTGNYVLQASAEGYKMKLAGVSSPTKRHAALTQNFELEKLLHPYTLSGKVTDVDTQTPLQAEIVFKPVEKDSVTHRIFSDKTTGEYSITFEDKFDLTMTVSAKDYFVHSQNLRLKNTVGNSEEHDVELEKSVIAYTLSGKIIEELTNDPVPGQIEVFNPGEDEAMLVSFADTLTGMYSLTVYEPGPFLLEVNADGYFFNNMPLEFHPDTTLQVKNIKMQPMSPGARIIAENILFTVGKATLRAESYPELNRLVRLLNENLSVRIEVSGHTDNTGSSSLNKRLSRERALNVKRYLESQGINPDRIEYAGYGMDNPITPNTTPEGRAKNRRVEIKVIE
jgi:outer membrane protein OmpA-like peptidoglycan-associated protein